MDWNMGYVSEKRQAIYEQLFYYKKNNSKKNLPIELTMTQKFSRIK